MRKLYLFNLHSVIDVITNSSSELFIIKGKEKDEVEKLIETVYKNYLDEYQQLKATKDLTADEIWTYLTYTITYSEQKKEIKKLITEELCYSDIYNTEDYDLTEEEKRIVKISKKIKKDNQKYFDLEYIKENLEEVKNLIDPNNKIFYLFSIDDNPEWEYQEELETIGQRYHLG